jgi:dTDP-glucose 4,6-dehydratase
MMNRLSEDLDHILQHTENLWADVRGERIFITGGTGFVGAWLLESLLWANRRLDLGMRCTVLTRDPTAFERRMPHLACDEAVTVLAGDVRWFEFPKGCFPFVIHGATAASEKLNREDPATMLATIADGASRTLNFAEAAGTRRFLTISSGAVYGRQLPEVGRVPETYLGGPDPLDRRAAYAEGKRLAELLCALHAGRTGLECLVARCFTFAGPYLPLDVHFAIGNFIGDCIAGCPIEVRGDGTPLRSYLYAADLAIWLWTILLRGQSLRPYNVGSEEAIAIGELARAVCEALSVKPAVRIAGKPRDGVPAERYVPDTTRARRELGLEEWIPLAESIRRTAQWHAAGAPA